MAPPALVIHEIYRSIQGESTRAGLPCVFVRLTACNLRCVWCDTPYAFTGGRRMEQAEIVEAVTREDCRLVELTGGEPLLQPGAIDLMQTLVADRFEVLLETGGHMPIDEVPDEVVTILDVKCPGSGESEKMHWPNLDQLSARDEVKFVISDRRDFDFAADIVRRHGLAARVGAILFSPAFGVMAPDELSKWLLESALPARLQLQMHKYIWAPDARGV